jgi:hypothetical protein
VAGWCSTGCCRPPCSTERPITAGSAGAPAPVPVPVPAHPGPRRWRPRAIASTRSPAPSRRPAVHARTAGGFRTRPLRPCSATSRAAQPARSGTARGAPARLAPSVPPRSPVHRTHSNVDTSTGELHIESGVRIEIRVSYLTLAVRGEAQGPRAAGPSARGVGRSGGFDRRSRTGATAALQRPTPLCGGRSAPSSGRCTPSCEVLPSAG